VSPSNLSVHGRAWITIKGPVQGVTRSEFEYEIPTSEAAELLTQFCRESTIDKIRHLVDFEGTTWEVDEFQGNNLGLIVAEVTLSHESESFPSPDWLGLEVSHDPRYFNSHLSKHPFKDWPVEKDRTTKIPAHD
jgi:CYTH domain-containing protein